MKTLPTLKSLGVLLAFLWVESAAADPAKPIPVAAIFALTGRAASSNIFDLRGVQLAVEEINAAGGLGRPLELLVFDNQSSVIGSVEAVKKAIERKVVAIIGASWSDHSLAIAPYAEKAGIPMISTFSTNPRLTQIGPYIFRVCYGDTFQGRSMASFARHRLGIRKVAIFYESGNDYSTDLAKSFRQSFESMGGKIVAEFSYLQDTLDYSGPLGQIKNLKPQAIFVPGYEKETGLIIQQAYKLGLSVPFLGGDGWGDTLTHYLGGDVREAYEIKPWNPEDTSDKSRSFVRAYRKRYGQAEPLSGGGAALGYDAVMLLADAIRRAKSADPGRIRQALAETTDFVGVTGPIRFDRFGDPIRGAVINRYRNSRQPSFFTSVNP